MARIGSTGGTGMQSRYERSVMFTVRAFPDQAERWEAAAAIQSGLPVGEWLGETADAYLQDITKSGKPLPLKWYGTSFGVLIHLNSWKEPRAIEVRGRASGPFAVFRGSYHGLAEPPHLCYSLVHRPSLRIIGTFPRQKDCMMLAAELAPLRINWEEEDAEKIIPGAPDEKRVQEIYRLYELIANR